ncbi:MAG: MG2 domain-containing protein [Chryseolinea sp.]
MMLLDIRKFLNQSIAMLFLLIIVTQVSAQNKAATMTQFDYQKAWSEVTQFQDKGLPESALKAVNGIYDQAKKDGNAAQLVKSVIHRLKFTDYKEENGFAANLQHLKVEVESSTFPAKPLLHSMLGEMYWQYYQNNRYRFLQRTKIEGNQQDDIETWSLHKIVSETFTQYRLSLSDEERSKTTPIELYDEIIVKGNKMGRVYRPTLFDFLAHRALEFSGSDEAAITKPAYAFQIDDAHYFDSAEKFEAIPLTTRDSVSMKHFALNLFQNLIRFHIKDKDPSALVEIDMERLIFVKEHYKKGDGEALYTRALEALEKSVITNPISTRVAFLRAQHFQNTATRYMPLQGEEHKWDLKRADNICDSAMARFKDSSGALQCENLQHEIKSRSIISVIEENNLPALPFRSLIRYRNISNLHYRIIKITRVEVRAQRAMWERNHDVDREEKFLEYFVAKPATKNGTFTLPDDHDFQEHSLEIKLDAVPVGDYMILYSNLPDFKTTKNGLAYAFTTITNVSYINRNTTEGGTDVFVLHRNNGKPLAGATAVVNASMYNRKTNAYDPVRLGTFTTDAQGFFHIPYLKKESQRNFSFDFEYKGDKSSSEPIDKHYGGSIGQYKIEKPHSRVQTHFFLDRSIYRPGQPIHFKGLVVRTDGKTSEIISGHQTKLTLYDVNSQAKEELNVTSNEYGTYSGTFTAPSSGLTGEMTMTDSQNSGSASFSVEEYKRPKFEVTFDSLKGSYKVNDTVKVVGSAIAYSGAFIDGATVTYRVVRVADFPLWWWYRWGYYPTSPEMAITQGETKTDTKGSFDIDFAAIPDLTTPQGSDPTFRYTVYADVTDVNGETHSRSTTVSIGYKSLLLDIHVGDINLEETPSNGKEVPILTTNLGGQFEPAQGKISISLLKSPSKAFRIRLWAQPDRTMYTREQYYEYFPSDLFDDELNVFKWERKQVVFTSQFNTSTQRSFNLQNLKSWQPGEYVIEATALDKNGAEVKSLAYFTIYSPKARKIPAAAVNYFQPIRLTVEPGEKATFSAGTTEQDVIVLYELEQNGSVIFKQWVKLNDEQRYFEIPVREEYRGNVAIHWTFIKNNRLYNGDHSIVVPFTNKDLNVSFQTFRDKLQPGQKEQWKILVKGKSADMVAAETVATLYDQSLDSFREHGWYNQLFAPQSTFLGWQSANGFNTRDLTTYTRSWNTTVSGIAQIASFDELNWFDYDFYQYHNLSGRVYGFSVGGKRQSKEELREMKMSAPPPPLAESLDLAANQVAPEPKPEKLKEVMEDLSQVPVRANFDETAFFYPHLNTNEQGEIIINFAVPEALTRWKMLGFTHTKDLQHAFSFNQLVTQKELMVVPNQPRFFRENDKMTFAVKITSLVEKDLEGEAQLEFFDAMTSKPVKIIAVEKIKQKFQIKAKHSTSLEWMLEIPENVQALTYRVVAKSGNFSDGEEMTIPVLTNRMLVTETLPLPVRGKQSKDFRFEKLITNKSSTLKHQRFTLEFTSNPAWLAVQALPYLMEYPYDCVEQTFSKFYANSIASHIANSNPKIKQVFDTWRNIQTDALISNLEKNQELKTALLEETPWVLQANNESARKRNVGLLFDLNKMANEKEKALDKVIKAQNSSGGFSWFPGLPEDRFMTQHIVSSMGHLDVMGIASVRNENKTWQMISSAIDYLDDEMNDDYKRLKASANRKEIKLDEKNISYLEFHYLYARSYFKDKEVSKDHQEAFKYFLGQAKKYWLGSNLYVEGLTCLALHRFGEVESTTAMVSSFKERALHNEEMGMFWKNEPGYYWYQAPVETQALMIEVFDEVANDKQAVEDMKVWLLKQKQTQDWRTTKATTEACYALLRRGTDILAGSTLAKITIGKQTIDPEKLSDSRVEAGTGYFKTAWQATEITDSMGKIHVENTAEGIAWGAAYWQYFEQLDKITSAETPLKIKKELFKQSSTPTGLVITPISNEAKLKVGDLVKVRIELRSDRDMEYVHLKDMRAAGLEPTSTISTFRFQDGLYYYESPRDMATNFFIAYLPKGTYIFEYSLRVSQKGDFSNGVTTAQCMYAPEFTSHSQGIRLSVD